MNPKGLRILVIDDNRAIQEDFIKILTSHAKEVVSDNKIHQLEENILALLFYMLKKRYDLFDIESK